MQGFRITDGKGFHIAFDNGWTVSVQFGLATYSSNRNPELYMTLDRDERKQSELKAAADGSATAEVAAWGPDGDLIHIENDTVAGWKDPAWVLAFMNEIAAKPAAKSA